MQQLDKKENLEYTGYEYNYQIPMKTVYARDANVTIDHEEKVSVRNTNVMTE